jgi:hypothetical protein
MSEACERCAAWRTECVGISSGVRASARTKRWAAGCARHSEVGGSEVGA